MKHPKLIATTLVSALVLAGCNNNSATGTPAPTATISDSSTEVQKVGYALGYDVGSNFRDVADDIDLDAFYQGLKDAYAKKDPQLTEAQIKTVMEAYQSRKEGELTEKTKQEAEKNKADGAAYLAENKKKAGVKTTESGLQYKVITEGSGTPPKPTDVVVVHYEGKFIDGKVFDSSYERDEPAQFPVDGVIPGWTEGLQLMKPGAKYELYIPEHLAYGEVGNGTIPPNSTLTFVVELLNEADAKAAIEKAKQKAADQAAQMEEMMKQLAQGQAQAPAGEAQPQGQAQPGAEAAKPSK